MKQLLRAGTAPALLTLLVAGCSSSGEARSTASSGPASAVRVDARDDACEVAATALPAGPRTFAVSNKGSSVTEVYVYAAGDRILGEVENIGPGTSKKLTVDLAAGTYHVACKPGMRGDGIRTSVVVEPAAAASSAAAAAAHPEVGAAVATYSAYVRGEAAALVKATTPFVAAVRARHVADAKRHYAAARRHYERMEPVAESFGDLDPRIDARHGDVPAGTAWTGFHRLERDLWQRGSVRGDADIADQLLADTKALAARVGGTTLTVDQIGNGAKGLLDEVATSKVTGEEERYSHLDLVDFAGNVEGAKAAWTALRPVVRDRDRAVATDIDMRFRSLERVLHRHAKGTSYVPYTALSRTEVRALAAAVDALAEPLSRVTAVALRAPE